MAVHIHIGGKTITVARARDAEKFTRVELEDLAERFLAALARVGHKSVDEEEGHPFHGNQYTQVAGAPKPDKITVKGVKKGVHELLSSGHPFSVEELKSITGAKLHQQIHNAINELKKGGPGLGLTIEKVGGHYQVVKAAQEAPKAATPPTPPAQALASAPSPVSGAPSGVHVPAPASPVTKEKADYDYDQDILGAIVAGLVSDPKVGAQKFKEQKALAMAKWKANVTGVAQNVKPVTVFPEDVEFIKALNDTTFSGDHLQDSALMKSMYQKWKIKTQEAKGKPKSLVGVQPLSTEIPKPAAKPVEVEPAKPVPVGSVTIQPAGYKNLSEADVKTTSRRKALSSLAAKVTKALNDDDHGTVPNKMAVESKLKARLADSVAMKKMQELKPDVVRHLVAVWAGSSGDHHVDSVALQLAVRDAFGMKHSDIQTSALGSLTQYANEDDLHEAAKKAVLGAKSTSIGRAAFRNGLQDFVKAMHSETQDYFKSKGITEIVVARGQKVNNPGKPEVAKLKLQPASSFTTSPHIARRFAGSSSAQILIAKVPVSQVIGSYLTGFGCTSEKEVVLLHHNNLQGVVMNAKLAEGSATVGGLLEAAAVNMMK